MNPVRIFLMATALTCCSHAAAADGRPWPAIQPFTWSGEIGNPDLAAVEMIIHTVNKDVAYQLMCFPGGYDSPEQQPYNFAGLLECGLFERHRDQLGLNLLVETQPDGTEVRRGRFVIWDLRPGCAQVLDWGARRRFRLLGMDLAIELLEIEFDTTMDTQFDPPARFVNRYHLRIKADSIPTETPKTAAPADADMPRWFPQCKPPTESAPR